MDIKEIALKVGLQVFEEHPYDDGHVVSPSGYTWIDDKLIEFAEALISAYKAELLKEVGEPVAARRKVAMWQGGDDYKYEWAVVKEHTPGTEPLYTSDQVAAAVAKATKPLKDQLTKAEQRVAEWQPIDTAPKDQPVIVARIKGDHIFWVTDAKKSHIGFWSTLNGRVVNSPTHWCKWRKFVKEV